MKIGGFLKFLCLLTVFFAFAAVAIAFLLVKPGYIDTQYIQSLFKKEETYSEEIEEPQEIRIGSNQALSAQEKERCTILSTTLSLESNAIILNIKAVFEIAGELKGMLYLCLTSPAETLSSLPLKPGEVFLLTVPLFLEARKIHKLILQGELKGRGTITATIVEINAIKENGDLLYIEGLPIRGTASISEPITFSAYDEASYEEAKRKAQSGDSIELLMSSGKKVLIPVK